MTLPGPGKVSELLSTLLGVPVETTTIDPVPTTNWLALSMLTTPDGAPIAVVGADTSFVAVAGMALAGSPLEGAKDAIANGKVAEELWDSFVEIGNHVTTLFAGDRFPGVVLRWIMQVDQAHWDRLFAAGLPATTMRIDVQGGHGGTMTFIALADAGVDSLPSVLSELAPRDSSAPDERWRPYSFRRPSGVNRDFVRALNAKVVEMARAMAVGCNGLLTIPVQQKVQQFQHVAWDDYAAGIVDPSLFISFQLKPLEGRFLLSWPIDLAMSLVDSMLGGTGAPLPAERMPSPLEIALLDRLFARALAEVPSLFGPFATTSVSDVRVDLDAKLFQGPSFNTTFLVAWMSIQVAGVEYQATLGIPTLAVKPFVETLLGRGEEAQAREVHPAIQRQLLEVPVEVRVAFRPIALETTRLAALRPGDVIALDSADSEPLHMACGKVELAAVEPITHDGRLLVKITRDAIERRAVLQARP